MVLLFLLDYTPRLSITLPSIASLVDLGLSRQPFVTPHQTIDRGNSSAPNNHPNGVIVNAALPKPRGERRQQL